MPRRLWWAGPVAVTAATTGPPAWAQERELSLGHPIQLEDAFYTPTGEGALLVTAGGVAPSWSHPNGDLRMDLQYTLFPRTQLTVGTVLSTSRSLEPSGDLGVSARVSICGESTYRPFLAAQLGATFPSGDSHGVKLELKGFASKGITLGLLPIFLHLNAAVDGMATGRQRDDRLLVYHLAVGPSFTVPWHAPATIVADVVADQSSSRGERETITAELGLRYRVSAAVAVHAAVGTTIAGPERARHDLLLRAGFSIGFEGPVWAGSRGR